MPRCRPHQQNKHVDVRHAHQLGVSSAFLSHIDDAVREDNLVAEGKSEGVEAICVEEAKVVVRRVDVEPIRRAETLVSAIPEQYGAVLL